MANNSAQSIPASLSDGGRNAFFGFLYQILAYLAFRSVQDEPTIPPPSNELSKLLARIPSSDLWHEYFEEDIVLEETDSAGLLTLTFIQLKGSQQDPLPGIGLNDMREIVDRFYTHEQEAASISREVTEYKVVTNRPEARAWLGKLKAELDADPTAPARKLEILNAVRIIPGVSLDYWDELLKAFGRQFGADEEESANAILKLIGLLYRRTVEQSATLLSPKDLIEVFTGFGEARSLFVDSVREVNRVDLREFYDHSIDLFEDKPIPRSKTEVLDKAIQERALVVLTGDGGCGKTVLLWDWVVQQLEKGGIGTIQSADEVREKFVPNVVSDWRGFFPREAHKFLEFRSEDPALALGRVRNANLGIDPLIILLGIDGLDEGIDLDDRRHRTKQALRWFFEEDRKPLSERTLPGVCCVVTCRDSMALEEMLPFYTGFGKRPSVTTIRVDDFDDKELKDAASKHIDLGMTSLIEHALDARSVQLNSIASGRQFLLGVEGTSLMSNEAPPNPRPIDYDVVDAIHHPAMWRALMCLPESFRIAALEGDKAAQTELAKLFVLWFVDKVERRNKGNLFLSRDGVRRALTLIAQSTQHTGRCEMYAWSEPARRIFGDSDRSIGLLRYEALSGGLTCEQVDGWSWRHMFVAKYLAEMTP